MVVTAVWWWIFHPHRLSSQPTVRAMLLGCCVHCFVCCWAFDGDSDQIWSMGWSLGVVVSASLGDGMVRRCFSLSCYGSVLLSFFVFSPAVVCCAVFVVVLCFAAGFLFVFWFCVLFRDWVVASDVTLRWLVAYTRKGQVTLTRKGGLWNRLFWCPFDWFSDISRSVESCRSQVFRAATSPVVIILLSFAIEIGLLCSKELLCLLRCSGGCWYVDRYTVLAVDLFAIREPDWSFWTLALHFFFL